MTYQLKPETIETLKARPFDIKNNSKSRRNAGDLLSVPLYCYYAKPQYSRRTARHYSGVWQKDLPPHTAEYERKYYCDELPNWRNSGYADEVNRNINDRGWFADHWLDETIRGVVLQLPAQKKEPQYIPAIVWSDSNGVTVWPKDCYTTAEECARTADSYAETAAEESREYRAKEQAGQDIETLKEEISESRETLHTLIQDLRKSETLQPAICDVVKKSIIECRREVAEKVNRIRALRDNFWVSVEGGY